MFQTILNSIIHFASHINSFFIIIIFVSRDPHAGAARPRQYQAQQADRNERDHLDGRIRIGALAGRRVVLRQWRPRCRPAAHPGRCAAAARHGYGGDEQSGLLSTQGRAGRVGPLHCARCVCFCFCFCFCFLLNVKKIIITTIIKSYIAWATDDSY